MDNYDKLKLENQLCFPLYVCSKEIVKKYGQEKLLYFYNELDKKEKEILVKQILEIVLII